MAEENQTTEEVNVTLTVQDLTLIANIVDLAVQRGAFKGAEVKTVGSAFEKLVEVLKAIAPEQVTSDEEATEEG